MFASIRRAWTRAFNPQPLPAPDPIRFDLSGCQPSLLHIIIIGGAGGGKTRLAKQIWSALENDDRARTYIETGYHTEALEREMQGVDVTFDRVRRGNRIVRLPALREGRG